MKLMECTHVARARRIQSLGIEDGLIRRQPLFHEFGRRRYSAIDQGRGVRNDSCKNGGSLKVKSKDEFGHDAKVASCAANSPE